VSNVQFKKSFGWIISDLSFGISWLRLSVLQLPRYGQFTYLCSTTKQLFEKRSDAAK
jgi:hypothetical protein